MDGEDLQVFSMEDACAYCREMESFCLVCKSFCGSAPSSTGHPSPSPRLLRRNRDAQERSSGSMYSLHLQYPALTLHPLGLHGHLVPPRPSPATPPFRRRSPLSPILPAAAARRRFACAPRASAADNPQPDPQDEPRPKGGFWAKWTAESAEMRARVAKLGLAAVLAYGLFDAVTYTTFFVLAFLGYEKSTGKNPAANLKALLGIVILIDRGLKGMQEKLNLPSQMYAFLLVVGSVAVVCFTVVGFLVLSKWGM
uniref:Uncharacterized protein n=1 Tax=Avena sativa TaxID=4498 RepID=A0ACD5UVB7_AVESA